MSAGFVHDRVLIGPVESFFREKGAEVHREYPVCSGRVGGRVDLLVDDGPCRLVVEAELCTRRMPNDVTKAVRLEGDILLILVPHWRLARAGAKRLKDSGGARIPGTLTIWILPLGAALQRLRNKCHLMTLSYVRMTLNQKMPAAASASVDAADEQERTNP